MSKRNNPPPDDQPPVDGAQEPEPARLVEFTDYPNELAELQEKFRKYFEEHRERFNNTEHAAQLIQVVDQWLFPEEPGKPE